MNQLEIVNLAEPTEVREFPYGRFEVFRIAGRTLGRAIYEPGWRWSVHVGVDAGSTLCQVAHLGLVIEGCAVVKMADRREKVMKPGDLFAVPPGHDSWVVGDQPYVSLHLIGADEYTEPR